MTLRRLQPFSRTLGIYLEHDLSHTSAYLWHGVLSHHGGLWERPKTSISIVPFSKWCLNQCETMANVTSSEAQIYIATGRNLSRDNGMINTHGLIKSSKGYSISKPSVRPELQPPHSGESWHFVCRLIAVHHLFRMLLCDYVNKRTSRNLLTWGSEFFRCLHLDFEFNGRVS